MRPQEPCKSQQNPEENPKPETLQPARTLNVPYDLLRFLGSPKVQGLPVEGLGFRVQLGLKASNFNGDG